MTRILAEAIMLAHFAFLVYLTLGGFLAWRWRRAIIPHLVVVTWGLLIVVFAWTCPLTTWENYFRSAAGVGELPDGFIDTYIDGVIYPEEYVHVARAVVGVIVLISWVGWWLRWRRRSGRDGRGASNRMDRSDRSGGSNGVKRPDRTGQVRGGSA